MAPAHGACLCVRGLPASCQVADLDALFRPHGRVANVHLPVEPVLKGHRGYAFVTMSSPRCAHACLTALAGAQMDGRPLTIEVSHRSAPHEKTPGVYLGAAVGEAASGDPSGGGGCRGGGGGGGGGGVARAHHGGGRAQSARGGGGGPQSPRPRRRGGGRRGGAARGARGGDLRAGQEEPAEEPALLPEASGSAGSGAGRTSAPAGGASALARPGGADGGESLRRRSSGSARLRRSSGFGADACRSAQAQAVAVAEPLSEPAAAPPRRSVPLTQRASTSPSSAMALGGGASADRCVSAQRSLAERRRNARRSTADLPLAEPLSEPAAAAAEIPCCDRVEPVAEPGGEPLIEEDPAGSPLKASSARKPPPPQPALSPRSRISQLEDANIRVAAKQTVDGLLLHYQQHGFADPRAATYECLRVSMELLGPPSGVPPRDCCATTFSEEKEKDRDKGLVLVCPEDFKNPSSFLRIYGDPLASQARRGGFGQPESRQDGNWRCEPCGNVNFPRRQRCHKCQAVRGPAGDAIVLQYCLRVYDQIVRGGLDARGAGGKSCG
eukprot:TRINITY_DN3926_c0_g2_i1.p1 TRINITY_DN3926_c0_g2~~TRINITY_DN3926_c0_g2_i1.p1  ORF type:complete len:554 (-),score=96.90 TRINITY_DN3926_c0_g2_i1:180-1841(-)